MFYISYETRIPVELKIYGDIQSDFVPSHLIYLVRALEL